ncbi:MAG: serine protease [Planctomycetota bacterium]
MQSNHQNAPQATASSGMALWLSASVGIVLFAMVLFCGIGGIGMAIFRSQAVTSSAPGKGSNLDGSVALVYCGWRVTKSTGTASEEPAIVNVLGVDEISDPAYVSKFVKEGSVGRTQIEGKTVYYDQLLGSSGTGFPITKDGYILTNKHVVEEVDDLLRATEKMKAVCKMNDYSEAIPIIWVFVGGEPYPADIVHVSQTYDLAIIKCSQQTPKFFSLSTANQVERGVEVSVVGFPGVVRDMNQGIAAFSGRDVNKLGATGTAKGFLAESDLVYYQTYGQINSQSKVGSMDVILHGAKINAGNSGGPLVFKETGVVLAINTWGHSQGDVNASLLLSQTRSEIDRHVPGVRWVK